MNPLFKIIQNLFSSPKNSFITVILIYVILKIAWPFLEWALFNASWLGDSREACEVGGACWVFVKFHFKQFIYGFYPESEQWRVNLVFMTLFLLLMGFKFSQLKKSRLYMLSLIVGFPIISYTLFVGGFWGLSYVETNKWGGLTLTLVISGIGIALALPIGIVLALGRRSRLPVIKMICILFIELWRGVPLITVLFMASVMLPLFLPEGVHFDKLLRALVGVTLFSGAYMAEVIRGGLQGLSKGQYEAADTLGLSYWQKMRLVILPQALKLVIPGIVNTFIGLFKDTTLVLIIGLFDLLGIVQAAATNPKWLGFAVEGYLFAGFGFWIFCFSMSRMSQRLEHQLNRERKGV